MRFHTNQILKDTFLCIRIRKIVNDEINFFKNFVRLLLIFMIQPMTITTDISHNKSLILKSYSNILRHAAVLLH